MLEHLFAVDRAEHSVVVRVLFGVPLPLLLLVSGPLLGAPGSATMWFVASTTVFMSGWCGGFVSGATATLVSAAIVHHWLLPMHEHQAGFVSDELSWFLAFVAAGLIVSLLHGRLRSVVRRLDARRIEARSQAQQLEETQSQLQEARARLELALDSANIGFWRWDLVSRRIDWDQRLCEWFELTGVPHGEIRYEHWASRVHPDDLDGVIETVRRAREDGKPRVTVYRIVLPGGSQRYIKSSGIVEYDASGQQVALIGIHQDVTADILNTRELAARQREVQTLNRQLEERVAERTAALLDALLHAEAATHAKAAFLRNISHELRTPLNPILGCSHLLAQSLTDPEQRAHLRHIEAGGRRLLALVTDLIELTSTANDDTSHTAVDIAATIHAAIDTFGLAAREKGLQFETHVDAKIPRRLTGDAVRVSQVLMQFISNAIKFSERGPIQVRSTLGRDGPDCIQVRFEVEDQGIGIDPDMQAHVFDAFRQVRDSTIARADGLGIGLALAKRAAERMGGEIGVHSTPGSGSTFWFTARFLREPRAVDTPVAERLYG